MVGSSIANKGIGRLGAACAVALLAFGIAPAGAQAEPPMVTITAPTTGTLLSESSPTFSGTTNDTLDTVTLDVFQGSNAGGSLIRQEPTTPVGEAWSLQVPSLPDGTYTAVAKQGAEEVGTSGEVTFRIDTTAPVVTLEPVPALLATATPSFGGVGGQAEGDEPVRVLIDGSFAGEAPVSGGRWSFTSSHLSDGNHTVSAEQADEAGHVSTTAVQGFRIDTTPPGPLSLNPVPAVVATATPSFAGSGGEAPGDRPVRVLIDGKLVGEAGVSGGSWAFTVPASAPLSDGTYSVRVEQSDEAGNTSKTNAANFRVDTTAPAPTVTGPKAGELLKSSLVEFKGGAGNATGDASEVTVEIFHGSSTAEGELEQTFTAPRSGSSWSSGGSGPRLSNGTHTVRVKQVDSVGNTGISLGTTFAVESPAPSVTLGELPRFTAKPTPAFGGSAETSGEAKPEVTLKIWQGTSASGKLVESSTAPVVAGTWALSPVKALADGTYTAQAEQPSMAPKNPAGVSNTTTFTVDTKAPELTLTAPGQSDGLETVSGAAGTEVGDRRQVTAELFNGETTEAGALFETITVNDSVTEGRGTWSATFANLPGGTYTVRASQSDEAGNVGTSASRVFTVTAPPAPAPASTPSPSPPVASFTWVPAEPPVGQSVSFVSKSTDDSTAITGYGWDFAGGGPFVGAGQLATTTFATPGVHTVRLQVTDANGLSSVATEAVHVTPQVLTLMQPFPIVRIAGSDTSYGVKIRLLSVQAPLGAKIAVFCKGHGCKTKSENRVVAAASKGKTKPGALTLSFPRFQRALKAGAVLQIRVTKAGQIGKFTSFTIRRNKLPVRVDACLSPPSTKPSTCPSQ